MKTSFDDDYAECESVSPHGNKCMLVPGHKGRHEIFHMMGEEDWDDNGDSQYSPAL